MGFSSCDIWAQLLQFLDSRTQPQCLWHTGLVALGHVGSSQTRDPVSPALQAESLPLSQQGSPADRFFITESALPMSCLQDADIYFPELLGVLAADGSQLSALSGVAPCRRKFLAQGFIPSTVAAQWLISIVGTKTWAPDLNSGQL